MSSSPYGAFQPVTDLAQRWKDKGTSILNGDALRQMLGMAPQHMSISATPDPAQTMNWTPQPNAEQEQEIQREQPMRKAMKDAVRK